jgi:hypothetical protein
MKTTAVALRPFVPSGTNFALTKAFLCEIGFELEWESNGLAGLRFGAAAIILQDIDIPAWQSNQMLVSRLAIADQFAAVTLGNCETQGTLETSLAECGVHPAIGDREPVAHSGRQLRDAH